jgi:hypothetical protein
MAQIAVRVRLAYFTDGSLKSGTPLLTASTPVMAVQPLANARSSSQMLAVAPAAASGGGGTTGTGCPSAEIALTIPINRITAKSTTKAYVGMPKARPDSRTPRRFTRAITTRMPRQRARMWSCIAGKAETSAPTPAEIPTAALRT